MILLKLLLEELKIEINLPLFTPQTMYVDIHALYVGVNTVQYGRVCLAGLPQKHFFGCLPGRQVIPSLEPPQVTDSQRERAFSSCDWEN